VSTSTGGASRLNIAGSQNSQQKGPTSIPGIDNSMGGAASLNLPGSTNSQSGLAAAKNAIAKVVEQENTLLNQATQGGVNALNVPTSTAPGVSQAEGGISGFLSSVWSAIGGSGGASGDRSASAQSKSAEAIADNTNDNSNNNANTSPVNTGNGLTFEAHKNVGGDPNKPFTSTVNGSQTPDGKVSIMSVMTSPSLISSGGKNNSPNPEDSSSPISTSVSEGLAANSSYAKKDHGGGAGNSGETAAGTTGNLALNSSYARKNNGDGTDGRSDNNHLDQNGALAADSGLARKNNGDGGGSDTRGGGGTSTITGSAKTVNPGGGHNQISGAAIEAN